MSHYRLRITENFFETLEDRNTHIYMHNIASYAASEFLKNPISEVIRDYSQEEEAKTLLSSLQQIAMYFETRGHISPDIGEDWHEDAYTYYDQSIDTLLKTADVAQSVQRDSQWARVLRAVANQITPYRDGIFREITLRQNEEGTTYQMPISKHSIFNAHSMVPALAADIALLSATLERKISFSRSEEKEMEYEGLRDRCAFFVDQNLMNSTISKIHNHTDKTLKGKIAEARGIFNYASDVFIGNEDYDLACLADSLDSWIGDLSERQAQMEELGERSMHKRVVSTTGNVTQVAFGNRNP